MNLARQRIQAMKPYSPPLAGRTAFDGLLLDFNERSDAPKIGLGGKINRYPEYGELMAELAVYCGIGEEQIVLTNGSDQAIDVVFRTFVDAGDKVTIPSPTFGMIEQAAQLADADVFAPLYRQPDLAFPLEDVLTQEASLIVLCNPNSPTGTLLAVEQIAAIAKAKPQTLIMVDEAYFEFSGVTAVGLIGQYPNIVVTRTFSKAFGLAGLRLGYAIASIEHISEMRKVCGPYSVSNIAQAAGLRVLKNQADVREYVAGVTEQAKPLVENFFAQNNIICWPSAGNFVLFRPADWQKVLSGLERRGMVVRPQDRPGTRGCLRVTVTTKPEMQRFITAYQQILRGNV